MQFFINIKLSPSTPIISIQENRAQKWFMRINSRMYKNYFKKFDEKTIAIYFFKKNLKSCFNLVATIVPF